MRARRLASRVASMTPRQNACSDAVSGRTLVTKVFHYPFPSFTLRRGGRLAGVGLNSGVCLSTGVRRLIGRGGACRLAWQRQHAATPVIASTLVTNEYESGGVR
jgi:hypothetical protein